VGRDDGGKVTNVQHQSNWNCHYESPTRYNEYILIKFFLKERKCMNMAWLSVWILSPSLKGHEVCFEVTCRSV
jgi:hypothetical protein